ncbi:uncharacterized protein LOC122053707 [Zingiber officinale]|nr:uncharacterized protein LOC122053707 [Zingiber officinale]
MEEILSAHRKCLVRSIAKKKPVKVVYISNPMRVTASAATFRALVQKLTGRDSDVDAIASFSAAASVAEPPLALSGSTTTTSKSVDPCNSLVAPSEVFGGGFDAQMLENFWEFLSAPPCYELPMAGFIRH